jgi:hypothetical protein
VQGTYLYRVYNYHDSRACGYHRSVILSRLDGYWMGLVLMRVRLYANLYLLLDNNICLLLDNNICLLLDITLCGHVLLNWDIG